MCGIAGIIDKSANSSITNTLLKSMSDVIIHRGPDSEGNWISGQNDCGLAFRRLSIIDLTDNGNQPMHTPDSRYHIVFNGEIYNHDIIRKELIQLGYKYHSNTDTETILYGYQQWGVGILSKMVGMWAIAIWDDYNKKLLLARDRIGIKPLYFHHEKKVLVFGSEIKSILKHPDIIPNIDFGELANFLHFSMTSSNSSLFEGIKKIPSGSYLILENNECNITQYWNPLTNFSGYSTLSDIEIQKHTLQLLRTSIKDRMMSEVPFGVFLSGGIDSSLNVALMSELMARRVDTFTVGFKDLEKYNELYYAKLIAKEFNTNHHEILIDQKDAFSVIEDLVWHTDEPNGDPVCIPLYYLSKLTKQSGTTVIQVGEGSDEQFFGYDWIIRDWNYTNGYYKYFKAMPQSIKNFFYSATSPILNRKGLYIISEYIRRAAQNEELYQTGATRFSNVHLDFLLKSEHKLIKANPYKFIESLYNEIRKTNPNADQMQKMAYLELRHRLAETLLMRVDKITMAHSLEARVPFLDHRLVEFTMSLNENKRIKNTKIPKYLLKKASEGILPKEVIYRKKQGFAAPIKEWLRNEWYDQVYDVIKESFFVKSNIFDVNYIDKIFYLHKNSKFNFQNEIYLLYILEIWHRKFIN